VNASHGSSAPCDQPTRKRKPGRQPQIPDSVCSFEELKRRNRRRLRNKQGAQKARNTVKQTICNLEEMAKSLSNENHVIEKEIVGLKARISILGEHIGIDPAPVRRNQIHEEYANIEVHADPTCYYPSAKELNFELDDLFDQPQHPFTYQPPLTDLPEKTQRRDSALNVEMILGYLD